MKYRFFLQLMAAGVICASLFFERVYAATFTYSYDSLNRLTNTVYSHGFKESYSYDDAGNRLTRVTGGLDTVPPSVPIGLAFSTNDNGEILLSWSPSQDAGGAVAGYSIFLNGLFYTNTATTNIILTGLFPNTSYCVTIVAYDQASNISSQGSQLCFVTPEMNLSGNSVTTISIYPTATPNGSTSSNWSSFLTNGIRYLETGQGLSFDRTTPTSQ